MDETNCRKTISSPFSGLINCYQKRYVFVILCKTDEKLSSVDSSWFLEIIKALCFLCDWSINWRKAAQLRLELEWPIPAALGEDEQYLWIGDEEFGEILP